MQDFITSSHGYRKIFLVFVLTSLLILMICSYYDSVKIINYQVLFSSSSSLINNSDSYLAVNGTKYLVSSSKCRILDLDPFSKEAKIYYKYQRYKSCSAHGLLTYVTKSDNVATVHIDRELIPTYSKKKVKCCYSNVTRHSPVNSPDNAIRISECTDFEQKVTIFTDAIFIKCQELNHGGKKVYENVHTAIRITNDVQKKIDRWSNFSTKYSQDTNSILNSTNISSKHDIPKSTLNNQTKPLSILLVGIDSISRLNFFRTMPRTYEYVKNNGWITLEGYNKMDDNTFPNLMAIFTGMNNSHSYEVCRPKTIGGMDQCPLIWYTFRDLGYVTVYAEDEASISTFNFNKKGFKDPPTDYYLRPYVLATEKLAKTELNGMRYCTGPETAGERILNLLKEFSATFKETPNFGIFWMNSFSHNELNSPQTLDNKVKSTLVDLENNGVFENSLVVFFSDHGMRFGDIRLTETGWLEERLPFIYFSIPTWFKKSFPDKIENLVNNRNRLTTPYDVYMTLQHLIILSGFEYNINPSDACPQCQTLLEPIPIERSCEDAGIEQHWCTCPGYFETELESKVINKATQTFENTVNDIVASKPEGKLCDKITVSEYISTRVSQKFSYKNATYLLVVIKTHHKALFETTMTVEGDLSFGNYTITGDISRLDMYKSMSKCVEDAYLKKYCYCIK